MQIPVSEAAKLVGLNRKTLYKHIKSGKLTATTALTGQRQVETSELIRVYGAFVESGDNSKVTAGDTQGDSSMREVLRELAALRKEVQELKEQLALPAPQGATMATNDATPTTHDTQTDEPTPFSSIIARLKEKERQSGSK